MDIRQVGFPTAYASNEVKFSEEYGAKVFRAVMENTGAYRDKILKRKREARKYARGEQDLRKYLDEIGIEGGKQYVNISYQPTKLIQKFEKVVVDDYQQLKEKVKVEAISNHIKDRKQRKESDLKFNYEFKDVLQQLSDEIGIDLAGEQGYPTNDEELDLILSIPPEEREEMLMRLIVEKVFEDNDLESLKRRFLSDMFQVAFAGFHIYENKVGERKIDFVPIEEAIFARSSKEIFDDSPYMGRETTKTIGEIRELFDIPPSKEEELYKLAKSYEGTLGNRFLTFPYDNKYGFSDDRPYDDFTVRVYHIWYKTLETIEYIEGKTSTGRTLFEIESNGRETKRKRTGSVSPQIALSGWFAGSPEKCLVLSWGKAKNMIREGSDFEKLLPPYLFFMPDNTGQMDTSSAVELVKSEIGKMDIAELQIKKILASNPPPGYAVDNEAMMDVDLGIGDLSPLDIDSIYRQTGVLYYRKVDSEGVQTTGGSPITPLVLPIQDSINTYLIYYNNSLNNIREILGINPDRDGTADLRRVSTASAQRQFSVSQTATYYIYRSYLKSVERLAKLVGISMWNALKYGKEDRGILYYLGRENIDFIKEREDITSTTYRYYINPQMTQEDKDRLDILVQQCLSSGQLKPQDALMILSLEDIGIAEKYLRFYVNKNEKELADAEVDRQQMQAQAQGDMAVRTEEAKRETFQIQSSLQAQEWEIKGKNDKDIKALELASKLIQNEQEGKQIPPQYLEFVQVVMDNYMLKQEKSLTDTEVEIQNEQQQAQQEAAIQEVESLVSSGDITEEEGAQILGEMGVM